MKTHLRLFGVTTAVLAIGLWFLAAASNADDEKDTIRQSIAKLADTLKRKKTDDAKKLAAAIADKIDDVEDLMHLMGRRLPSGKGGIGVGDKPATIKPDGIELKIGDLAKDSLSKTQLAKEAAALERMAYIAAAIGQVAHAKPRAAAGGKKNNDWLTWSKEMHEASLELAEAAQKQDAAGVKTAAGKLEAKCTSCHNVFK